MNSLASDSRLNVVSSPSLMVLNNQEARIRVGDEAPIITQQQQSTATDANIINTIEFRETGVLLLVKPRVNPGGLVTMDIQQEINDVAPGTGASLTPTIRKRAINSSWRSKADKRWCLAASFAKTAPCSVQVFRALPAACDWQPFRFDQQRQTTHGIGDTHHTARYPR